MKQEDVAALAGLLNSSAEEVSQAIENGTVSEIINGFLPTVKIFPQRDFETLSENLKRQAIAELDKTKLPREVFEYVKGSVLEKAEKTLAKQYGITDYQGLDNLVENIITTKTKTSPDEETKALKQRIVEVENEYKTKLEQERKGFESRFIDTELKRVVSELPIDAEGTKLENQQEIVMAMVKAKFDFSMDNNRIQAVKEGKPITDRKLDPVPLKEVVYNFAKEYVNLRPEQGGRGDSSSTNGSRTINLAEYCEKNNIPPNSVQLIMAKKELEAKGYKLV